MQLYHTTLTPQSYFITPLRGDTLFGQACWSIRYLFGEARLETLLSHYENAPFLIVSDPFLEGFLPKPKLPSSLLGETGDDKKINRKKIWISARELASGNYQAAIEPSENQKNRRITTMHNSINYLTFSTESGFDPYGIEEYTMPPQSLYLLIDEDQITPDEVQAVLDHIGSIGYGKDASLGKGRFTCSALKSHKQSISSTTVMALSPFVAQGLACKALFYEPFVRFGKKGADRANQNPFKKPLLLADTASVVVFEAPLTQSYIGRSVKGYSSHQDIVHQGYAIAWPIKEL